MQLLALIWNDVKSRFAGSKLGILWGVLSPAVTIAIYWFVYTVALDGGEAEGVPYLWFLVAGILPWFFFSEGLTGATAVFRDYRFLVCNIRFRTERLPLIRVGSALLVHLVLLLLAYGALTLGGIPVRPGQAFLLFWIVGGFCLCLALGRIFALGNACVPDTAYGVNTAVQLGFWLTPVFWNPESLPKILAQVLVWNPAAVLVEGYRQALLFGQLPPLSHILIFWGEVLAFWGISNVMMRYIRPTLADRL